MMELHEENKVMREALTAIESGKVIATLTARDALAAVGSAAQPEGEATLFQQMAKATIQSQAQFFLQKARAEKAEAETDDVRIAAREEITALVARAEKAEAERDQARTSFDICSHSLAAANAALAGQPAPKAGDALGSIDEKEIVRLFCDAKNISRWGGNKGWEVLFKYINASRREAYDKGRAEGVGQAVVYPDDGTASPFTVVNLGTGKVKIGDAFHDGRLPALWFGKNGTGMGEEERLNRAAYEGETLAVVTFSSVEGLDVLLEVIQRIRSVSFPLAAPPASAAQQD